MSNTQRFETLVNGVQSVLPGIHIFSQKSQKEVKTQDKTNKQKNGVTAAWNFKWG